MTDKIDLLPVPEGEAIARIRAWSREQMQDYARANVLRHTTMLRAEVEALRAQVNALQAEAMTEKSLQTVLDARAERLNLDVATPEELPQVLRRAADVFRESHEELAANWQDPDAGAVWTALAQILDLAADSAERAIKRYLG